MYQDIDKRIAELNKLKETYPALQPIQNIINTQPVFEAKYIKDENVEDFIVQHKTAFICPERKFLTVKDVDGSMITYELVPPKDEKDIRIEELERRLAKYEKPDKPVA